jgi:hypothetical protein
VNNRLSIHADSKLKKRKPVKPSAKAPPPARKAAVVKMFVPIPHYSCAKTESQVTKLQENPGTSQEGIRS